MNKDKSQKAFNKVKKAWEKLQEKHTFSLKDGSAMNKSLSDLIEAINEVDPEDDPGFY